MGWDGTGRPLTLNDVWSRGDRVDLHSFQLQQLLMITQAPQSFSFMVARFFQQLFNKERLASWFKETRGKSHYGGYPTKKKERNRMN